MREMESRDGDELRFGVEHIVRGSHLYSEGTEVGGDGECAVTQLQEKGPGLYWMTSMWGSLLALRLRAHGNLVAPLRCVPLTCMSPNRTLAELRQLSPRPSAEEGYQKALQKALQTTVLVSTCKVHVGARQQQCALCHASGYSAQTRVVVCFFHLLIQKTPQCQGYQGGDGPRPRRRVPTNE